jgi:hypothetical protein
VRAFATLGEAYRWMEDELDDDCVDNHRHAVVGNAEQEAAYERDLQDGCCGFFDRVVLIAGVETKIGCNYGH